MYDDDTNGVNGENIVSWQVPVQVSYRQYTDEHERWTDVADSFSYEMTSKVDILTNFTFESVGPKP